jgi:hypothetical protein
MISRLSSSSAQGIPVAVTWLKDPAKAEGGLTVIANAPNPAGIGILQDARVFADEGISPLGLLMGALLPTGVAIVFFWCLR